METNGPGIRRLCIAVDLERYSQRDNVGQQAAQEGMTRILREAGERGALERAHWFRQEQGDGELALLPPGIDEARVIASLVRELRAGLFQYNRNANAAARLRMRVAVHQGITYVAAQGFAGDAVNTVCRLCDSPPAKAALRRHQQSNLVLIVSQSIYEDVITHDVYDLRSRQFSQVAVDLPDKGFTARAWIYLPDRDVPDLREARASRASTPEAASAKSGQPHTDATGRNTSMHVMGKGNTVYSHSKIKAKKFTGRDRIDGPPRTMNDDQR